VPEWGATFGQDEWVATIEGYVWADSEEDFISLTVAWIKYSGPTGDVLRAGGNTWTPWGRQTFMSALDFHGGDFDVDHEPLLFDRLGPWLVLIAPNGFEYAYPGVVAGASRLGDVVSVYWNVEGNMSIREAQHGQIARHLDLRINESDLRQVEREVGVSLDDPYAPVHAASLALVEGLTGEVLDRDWVLAEHEGVVLDRRVWAGDDPGSIAVAPYDP